MERKPNFSGTYKWGDVAKSDLSIHTLLSGKQLELIKAAEMVFPKPMAETGMVPDQRLNYQRVQQMNVRQDDILVTAYPKSGTHWVWEITQMLIKGKADYSPNPKEWAMLEFHLPEEFDDRPSPRVFNTHYLYHYVPKEMIDKKCKIIHVLRNPKDAAVSLYYQMKNFFGEDYITWTDFVHLFQTASVTFSNWFDYVLNWEKGINSNKEQVLVLYYEDIKEDPISKIEDIAKFLNVQYDKSLITEIANKVNFQTMKEAKIQHRAEQYKETPYQERMVARTQRLYRKGQVGDWKNHFTVAQNEQFDALLAEKLKESSYKFRFVLDN